MVTEADYIIVLGATSYKDRPSPVFRERIMEGIRLYQTGKGKKVIFTGKPGEPPQALVAKRFAISQGTPEIDILTEIHSNNTLENLYFAKALIPNPKEKTFLIVSDPLHLKRAMEIAKDLEMQAQPSATQTTQFQSPLNQGKFLLREIFAYSYYRIGKLFNMHQKRIQRLSSDK